MKVLAFSLFSLFFPLLVWAQQGLVLESAQGTYRKDGLYLKVYISENPQAFLKELHDPSRSKAPPIQMQTVFHRGEFVFPVILYSTNALTPDGRADISYDFVFYRPDGSVYEKIENMTVVLGRPPKGLGIYKDLAGLKIEETDPYGEYKVEVKIHDRNRKETVEMPFAFTVAEKSAKPPSLLTPEAVPESGGYSDRGESASSLLSPKDVKAATPSAPDTKP